MDAQRGEIIHEREIKQDNEIIKQLQVKIDTLKMELTDHKQQYEQLSKETERLRKEKLDLEQELSDTKSRLSKLVGDKVSDNNPDIADLGDTNRPTKIAERYHELYDNQWTDAFEIIVKHLKDKEIKNTEDQAITTLLHILLISFKFCDDKVNKENKELQKMFGKKENNDELPNSLKMEIKLTRRNDANNASMKVAEEYISMLKKCNRDGNIILKVLEFVKECVAVCWLMVIQDPKVVLHKHENYRFDSNLYKAYTVSGKTVQFVVWPALLLHSEGPTLAKGIAQCVKESQQDVLNSPSAHASIRRDKKLDMNVLKTEQKKKTTEPILHRKLKTGVNDETALSGIPSIQDIKKKRN